MNRQLRKGGGIMNLSSGTIGGGDYAGIPMGSRTGFGLLKKIGRTIRKIIPNEISKVATAAAPFVAPFNPQVAAAMAGIGSFDQTGDFGDALKRGALTYGGGQAARFIGGAGFQAPSLSAFTPSGFTAGFSSPIGTETGLGKFLDQRNQRAAGEAIAQRGRDVQAIGDTKTADFLVDADDVVTATNQGVGSIIDSGGLETGASVVDAATPGITTTKNSLLTNVRNKDFKGVTENISDLIKKGGRAVFYTPRTDQSGNVVGYDLDKSVVLAAGAFGLTYLDAKKIANEAGQDITEEEFNSVIDDAKFEEKKEFYANNLANFFGGKKDGGRIGFDEGANTKFAMIKDMLAKGMDEETIMSIAEATQADIDSVKNKKNERTEEAQGGRIGFRFGEKVEDKEGILSMMDKNKEDEDMLMAGVGNVMKLFTSERTGFDRAGFEDMLIQYSDSGAKAKGVKLMDFALDFLGISGMKEGGRIGFANGTDKNTREFQNKYVQAAIKLASDKNIGIGDAMMITSDEDFDIDSMEYKGSSKGILEILNKKAEGGRIGFSSGGGRMMETFRLLEEAMRQNDKDQIEILKTILRNEFSQKLAKGGRTGFKLGKSKNFKPLQIDPMNEKLEDMLEGGSAALPAGLLIGMKNIKKAAEAGKEIFSAAEKTSIIRQLAGRTPKFTEAYKSIGKNIAEIKKVMDEPLKYLKDAALLKEILKLKKAQGGRVNYNMGSEVPVRKNSVGIEELDYRQTGGFVPVGIKEKADDVPAMLSKNEFVMTADAVRGIGNGDVERGAQKLYNVMKQAEKVGRA